MATMEINNNQLDPKAKEELAQKIIEVRKIVLEEMNKNSHLYDLSELSRINDDWTIERFIRRKNNVKDTSEMIINTMKWRKEYELAKCKDEDFPAEFFKTGTIFPLSNDKQGNALIFLRIRLHRKVKELEKEAKRFIAYTVDKVDRKTNGSGTTIVFDCKGAGLSNMDMDILWFMVNSLVSYYPWGLSWILVYELPWVLQSAWTIVKGWLPEDQRNKIKFVNKNEILEYIDSKDLPLYMGGGCKINYHHIPKECRPFEEVVKEKGFTDKEVKKLLKHYQPLLDEADEEIKTLTA